MDRLGMWWCISRSLLGVKLHPRVSVSFVVLWGRGVANCAVRPGLSLLPRCRSLPNRQSLQLCLCYWGMILSCRTAALLMMVALTVLPLPHSAQ